MYLLIEERKIILNNIETIKQEFQTTPKRYRKKPVIVTAYQTDKELLIETLEGTMKADIGDFIITGVRGEKYPCKPDIFYATYDEVVEIQVENIYE